MLKIQHFMFGRLAQINGPYLNTFHFYIYFLTFIIMFIIMNNVNLLLDFLQRSGFYKINLKKSVVHVNNNFSHS